MNKVMEFFMVCVAPILWANLMVLAGSDIRFFVLWLSVTLAAVVYGINND